MKTMSIANILSETVLKLNETHGHFKNIKTKMIIKKFKKDIKSFINNNAYTPMDVYNFILFLNMASKLNLLPDDMDNLNYSFTENNEYSEVLTGVISYDTVYIDDSNIDIFVKFNSVINSFDEDYSNIAITFIFKDKNQHNVDYKVISSSEKKYDFSVKKIIKSNKSDYDSEYKLLENNSYDIIKNIFIAYSYAIFDKLEIRYLKRRKQI